LGIMHSLSPFCKLRLVLAVFAVAASGFIPPVSAGEEGGNLPYLFIESGTGLISLEARDIEIAELLRTLSEKTKTDITVGGGVFGKTTVKLSAATIEEVLKAVCHNSAIVYEYQPDTNGWLVLRSFAFSGANGKDPKPLAEEKLADASGGDNAKPLQTAKMPAPAGLFAPENLASIRNTPAADVGREKRPAYKEGELLVKFKTEAVPEEIAALHARLGSIVIKNLPKLRLQRIKLKDGFSEAEAIRQYQDAPIVEHAERHALRYPQATPNDPSFSSQWNLNKIGAEALWNITSGSRDVIVAVIDIGVDYRHPDLRDNIWVNAAEKNGRPEVDDDGNGYSDDIFGWDFADTDNNPFDPNDDPGDSYYGHGTHVAGIIGAVGNNGIGVSGVNWKVRIMPLKVKADNSSYITTADIIEAIDYAIANGARVVNCSFGGTSSSTDERDAFALLRERGIIAACAAGNGTNGYGYDMNISGAIYPACYGLDNIISVASTDYKDALAISSNYGKSTVDVAAPGEPIYSTLPFSGTSVKAIDLLPPAEYPAIGMEYAALTSDSGINGTLYDCGMGYPEQIPAAVSGNIALIKRGNRDGVAFYFYDKAKNAQAKGATGVIIYNNLEDDPHDDDNFDTQGGTLGTLGSWIPVVSISKAAGEELLSLLSEAPLQVALINKPTVSPYGYKSGTSMAAPHVAGLAGLIYSQCPTAGYTDVRASIINNVDKIPSLADKVASGGRINAFAALTGLFPPGDLSGNCRLGIEDAIIALQIIAKSEAPLACPLSVCTNLDIDGDRRATAAEAIYILQKISGAR